MRPFLAALALAAITLLLVAPSALAQAMFSPPTVTLELPTDLGIVKPGGEGVEAPFTATVSCDAFGAPVLSQPTIEFLAVSNDANVITYAEPAHVAIPMTAEHCAQGISVTVASTLRAMVTENAAALQAKEITVYAQAIVSNWGGWTQSEGTTLIRADFFGRLVASPETGGATVAPGDSTTLLVRVDNAANGEVRAKPRVLDAGAANVTIDLPDPFLLGGLLASDPYAIPGTQVVPVHIRVPSTARSGDTITMQLGFTGRWTEGNATAIPADFLWQIQVYEDDGLLNPAPAAPVGLLGLAAAVLAGAVRRWRA